MKARTKPTTIPRYLTLFLVVLSLSFIILLFSQRWILRTVRAEKQEQASAMLNLIRTTTDLSIDQIFKLSQLLLLDNNVSKFMYQRPVEEGSEEIQSLIDAKTVLPTATSINAMLAEIYLYSNRNGYILNSQNAFLDPEQMYDSLFAFDELNFRQFRSRYLAASFNRTFFPQTAALVHGRERQVIPLVQTFPLSNPASNAGKVVMLLDANYFASLLCQTIEGTNPTVYITDTEGRLITFSGNSSLIVGEQYPDGQHRLTVGGEEYILSSLTSEATGLRFQSLLSLKEINALLNPMWIIVAAVSVSLFVLIALVSLLLLVRSNRSWNELLELVADEDKSLPYEEAAGYISSIVRDDRSAVRQKGGTPFITDTFFRRLIHGRMLTTSEISAMLRQVQADIDLASPLVFQMLHCALDDQLDILSDELVEDLDFTRIAAHKSADEIFGVEHYLYMDASFSIWVMIWSNDDQTLTTTVDRFWTSFTKVSPLAITMAVSSAKRGLDEIFKATVECTEIQQQLKHKGEGEVLRRWEDISFSKDPYHYTAEMERKLHASVIRGDEKDTEKILRVIEEENYGRRSLVGDEHANLMRRLYASAVKVSQSLRTALPQTLFANYQEATRFFLNQASVVGKAKSDSEEVLVGRIVAYIDEHYGDVALNLSHMSSSFGMKESFLYHFMMTRMQSSFAQYLETYRLEQARVLFAEHQIPIAEVTTLVGYASPQTFRRAFYKRYGLLPSEYQRRVLYQRRET